MAPTIISDSPDAVFVVTGGNRGLGLEHVKQFLEKTKVKIVATARQPAKADQLNGLLKQHQARLSVIQLDTSEEASVEVLHSTSAFAVVCTLLAEIVFKMLKTSNNSGCCQEGTAVASGRSRPDPQQRWDAGAFYTCRRDVSIVSWIHLLQVQTCRASCSFLALVANPAVTLQLLEGAVL